MVTYYYSTQDQFMTYGDEIIDQVGRLGYAVMQPWDNSAAAFKEVAMRFGRIQSHIRADANGMVGIATDAAVSRDWEAFRSEYLGVNSEEFLPHTDGSYLHGMIYKDGAYEQLLPPRMLLLQCVRAADAGGGNVLIDSNAVRHDMARECPDDLATLSTKGCVTYCRDDQIALDCAVFHELPDGAVMLRFRYDNTAYVADWAVDAFETLQTRYFANHKYWLKRDLRPGEIMIVDNYRMLHGRDSFAEAPGGRKRQMRRVWLAHDTLPVMRNVGGQHVHRRALQRFEAYKILPATMRMPPADRQAAFGSAA